MIVQTASPARGQAQPGLMGSQKEGGRTIPQAEGQAKRTRPRGFAPWNPRPESLALVRDVQAVLDEYREHLPLTIRQAFYKLVAMRVFPKTETAYSRLCKTVCRARQAGLIPFASIRDDGAARYEFACWADPAGFLADVLADAQRFRLDRQEGQTVRLWVLCEARGMAPMLARVANHFGVPVLTSGGFDGLTAKHGLARELAAELDTGTRAEILHLGDLDPSGEHLFTSLAEDVAAMCQALCGAELAFTRLAVIREQADRLGLPTAPPKPTDRRRFPGDTEQCEAIAPDVLALEADMRAALVEKLGAAND